MKRMRYFHIVKYFDRICRLYLFFSCCLLPGMLPCKISCLSHREYCSLPRFCVLRKKVMLLVKIDLLLLAFYRSLFNSWIHFCIFSLSSLVYFSSDADSTVQLSYSCHTCAWNKTVLKGEFWFGVCFEQHCSLPIKPTERHQPKGLSWDSAGTVYPRAVSGVASWVCCQVQEVILWWFWFISSLCLFKVTTGCGYSLASFKMLMTADSDSGKNPSLQLMTLF